MYRHGFGGGVTDLNKQGECEQDHCYGPAFTTHVVAIPAKVLLDADPGRYFPCPTFSVRAPSYVDL